MHDPKPGDRSCDGRLGCCHARSPAQPLGTAPTVPTGIANLILAGQVLLAVYDLFCGGEARRHRPRGAGRPAGAVLQWPMLARRLLLSLPPRRAADSCSAMGPFKFTWVAVRRAWGGEALGGWRLTPAGGSCRGAWARNAVMPLARLSLPRQGGCLVLISQMPDMSGAEAVTVRERARRNLRRCATAHGALLAAVAVAGSRAGRA